MVVEIDQLKSRLQPVKLIDITACGVIHFKETMDYPSMPDASDYHYLYRRESIAQENSWL
jgi:hypothetical protein